MAKNIVISQQLQYNLNMRTRLQKFFATVSRKLQAFETRWLVLIIAVIAMLGFRVLGVPGLADVIGMIYIMFFVTFWQRHD